MINKDISKDSGKRLPRRNVNVLNSKKERVYLDDESNYGIKKEIKSELRNINNKKEIEFANINTINKNQRMTNVLENKKDTSTIGYKGQNKNNINYVADDKKSIFAKSKLKVIPLGGLNEIGKNMTVFEYEKDIIIVDAGLAFPEDDMLGVDLVIPDITYLEKNKEKIRGLFITHGHEDHIGSIPYLLKKINMPIYGTKLTLGLIKVKLQEHNLDKTTKLNCVNFGDVITAGKFKVEFIRTTHSIADSASLAIESPVGTIVHTGDFKVDFTPINSEPMDFARFAELGKKGVLMLMSDSTNVLRPGTTMSERSVGEEFDKIFMNCTKRIIVATFASNIHRMQQIINSAVKFKRKVAVVGRSMLNVMKVGQELGYLTAPEGTLIEIDKIGIYNPEQLVIITTGSQGEPMSALARMSTGEHKKVTITPDDLVIFSSSPIPGNEKSVARIMDELQKLGAEVIYNELADIHVSGHACQEELKLMLSLIKPKCFMPVHGEYRFLKAHAQIAKTMGVKSENIFIMENGRILELSPEGGKISTQVQSGVVLVDGLGVGDVGNIVLRDRQMLSENGMIIIVVTLDKYTLKIISGPDIVTRGFVYVRESETLMDEIKDIAREELKNCEKNKIYDWASIKSNVRERLIEFIYSKTKRQPMILPIIMEVNTNIRDNMRDITKDNIK